jgi:hypothetical protein
LAALNVQRHVYFPKPLNKCYYNHTFAVLQAAKQQAIQSLTDCAARLGDGQDLTLVNRMQDAAARTADATQQEQAAATEVTTTAAQVQQLRDRVNHDANGDATMAAAAVPSTATLKANLPADQIERRARALESVYRRQFNNLTYVH